MTGRIEQSNLGSQIIKKLQEIKSSETPVKSANVVDKVLANAIKESPEVHAVFNTLPADAPGVASAQKSIEDIAAHADSDSGNRGQAIASAVKEVIDEAVSKLGEKLTNLLNPDQKAEDKKAEEQKKAGKEKEEQEAGFGHDLDKDKKANDAGDQDRKVHGLHHGENQPNPNRAYGGNHGEHHHHRHHHKLPPGLVALAQDGKGPFGGDVKSNPLFAQVLDSVKPPAPATDAVPQPPVVDPLPKLPVADPLPTVAVDVPVAAPQPAVVDPAPVPVVSADPIPAPTPLPDVPVLPVGIAVSNDPLPPVAVDPAPVQVAVPPVVESAPPVPVSANLNSADLLKDLGLSSEVVGTLSQLLADNSAATDTPQAS